MANATVTANSGTVTYNGLTQTVTGFTATGLVNGETTAVLTGVTTTGGSGVNAGVYTHSASGSDINYSLTFVDGALTINAAAAPVVQQIVSVPVVPPTTIPTPKPVMQPASNPTGNPGNSGGTSGARGNTLGGAPTGAGAGSGSTGGSSNSGGSSGSGSSSGGTLISLEPSGTINVASSGQSSAAPGFVAVRTFEPVVVSSGSSFTVKIPENTFTHSESNSPIRISATTANGEPLPDWVSFSPTDLSLTGTPPQGVTSLSVVVVATDENGNQVSTQLTIQFGASAG